MTTAKLGLFVPLTAKAEQSAKVKDFLLEGYNLVQDELEPETLQWFAIKYTSLLDSSTTLNTKYLIFDAFAAESGRQAHLNGAVATALFANRDTLLVEGDEGVTISKVELLAHKVVKPAGAAGTTKGLTCGLLILLPAKADKVDVVRQHLIGVGANVLGDKHPPVWFGFEFPGTNQFAALGLFATEADREERLNNPSPTAQELSAKGKELFTTPPQVFKVDVLAAKI